MGDDVMILLIFLVIICTPFLLETFSQPGEKVSEYQTPRNKKYRIVSGKDGYEVQSYKPKWFLHTFEDSPGYYTEVENFPDDCPEWKTLSFYEEEDAKRYIQYLEEGGLRPFTL